MTPHLRQQWLAAMPSLKERAKTLIDLIDGAHFLLADRPIALDDKATSLLTAEAKTLLQDVGRELAGVEPWSAEATEQAVRAFAERKGLKLGSVAQPLRAALTGRTTSPGIFEVLVVLGKAESLARICDQTKPRRRDAARGLARAFTRPRNVCDSFVTGSFPAGAGYAHRLFSCSAHSVGLAKEAGTAAPQSFLAARPRAPHC